MERQVTRDSAEQLVADYLMKLGQQFYEDKKVFFQERRMLTTAITYLPDWLWDRHVQLPERRLRAILEEIIKGIQHHGSTDKIKSFGRYFLHVVQEHVRHHEDKYLDEAKDFRNALDNLTGKLNAKQAQKVEDARDSTTEKLATIARLTKSGPKGKAKAAAKKTDNQLTFF